LFMMFFIIILFVLLEVILEQFNFTVMLI